MLIVDCMGSFLSVRTVDQQRKQLLVRFYSRWYIMRSEVGVLTRQMRLATKRVVELSIAKSYGFDQVIFHCLD